MKQEKQPRVRSQADRLAHLKPESQPNRNAKSTEERFAHFRPQPNTIIDDIMAAPPTNESTEVGETNTAFTGLGKANKRDWSGWDSNKNTD